MKNTSNPAFEPTRFSALASWRGSTQLLGLRKDEEAEWKLTAV